MRRAVVSPSIATPTPFPNKRPPLSFNSEALLREAFRALLSKIPGVRLPQITHAAQEVGKDIIFYIPGGPGEDMLCACVVKNAPLDGKSSPSSRGALAILHQVEQALLNPKKMETGIEIPIQKVFVVTPYDLPDSTLNAIFGHLKDRVGRVEFVGGARLFELFKKHWPEFLADEFTAVQEHLRSTTVRLQEEKPLEQIAINYRLGAPDRAITKYYVQPNFHQDLLTVSLDHRLKSIIYGDFTPVMVPKTKSQEGKPQWTVARPYRITISLDDVEACKSQREILAKILEFLVEWECCGLREQEHILSQFASYTDRVEAIRDRRIAVDVTDRASTVRELTKKSTRAELTPSETADILACQNELSCEVFQALEKLITDLRTAGVAVRDPRLTGVAALNDARYQLAVKMTDMHVLAPPWLFANLRGRSANQNARPQREETADTDQVKNPITVVEQPSMRRIDFPNNFLDIFKSSVLIVGAAGYGKTSFCRWNALNDAERFAKGRSDCVPAYFALHEVARGPLNSFKDVFLNHVGLSALIPAGAVKGGDVQRLRLYLDGLDEVPRAETRREIVKLVKDGLSRSQNIQVVMTARNYIVGPWLSWLPKFHLSEFTPDQVERLLENWLDKDPARLQAFMTQLSNTPSLQKVISVPLLATLVILVFRLTGNLPSSRKRLYEIFVDLMNAGWDLAKGIQRGSRFGPVVKLAVLKRLAYTAHSKRLRQFPESLIRQTVSGCLKAESVTTPWRDLIEEMIQDGLLINSGKAYNFAHLSFQEYLAAANLIGDPHSNRRARVLGEFLRGDNWWKEVLSFYLELSSNMKELYEWIHAAADSCKGAESKVAEVQSRLLLQHLRLTFPDLAF
jgi:hypothetical protein